jgi:hypothetical protein
LVTHTWSRCASKHQAFSGTSLHYGQFCISLAWQIAAQALDSGSGLALLLPLKAKPPLDPAATGFEILPHAATGG